MILQTEDFSWLLALGLMFGLALLLTILTERSFRTFLSFLTIFDGFLVYSGLIELWTLVLCLIVLGIIIIIEYKQKKGV